MLDVKRLRVLREVSVRGSFSAAAEALAYTQSAVSQQIAALEREAGTTLVERNARGVRLTDAGRALVAHADVILARLADAEAELEAIAGMRGGRLRMVSFPTAGATIAPRAIARFRERHPGVEVTLAPREPDEGLDCLKSGECDIALTVESGFEPIVDRAIERRHLLDDPFYLCLPAGHRIASKARVRLADLAEESWILGTTGRCPDGRILERASQAAGFEARVAFQSDDYTAIQGFVAAGIRQTPTPAATTSSSAAWRGARSCAACSPPPWRAATCRPRPRRCSRSSTRSGGNGPRNRARWRSPDSDCCQARDPIGPARRIGLAWAAPFPPRRSRCPARSARPPSPLGAAAQCVSTLGPLSELTARARAPACFPARRWPPRRCAPSSMRA